MVRVAEDQAERGESERARGGLLLGKRRITAAAQVRGGFPEGLVRQARRRERLQLSGFLHRESTLERVRSCGRLMVSVLVDLKLLGEVAHHSGLRSCGSIWACPVCAAKIAGQRITELAEAIQAHLDGPGNGVAFLTTTFSHQRGDSLADLLVKQQRAWHLLCKSRTWRRLKAEFGVEWVRAREITWGEANGFHPHFHVPLLLNRWLSGPERAELERALSEEWLRDLRNVGLSGSVHYALRIDAWDHDQADTPEKLAGYLAKQLALETAAGTFKDARGQDRLTPWGILAEATGGDREALRRWHEYEQATFSQRFMTWSKGARALRDKPEQSDEELAETEVGGEVVLSFDREVKRVLWRLSARGVELLEICERDVEEALRYVLSHAPPGGKVYGSLHDRE